MRTEIDDCYEIQLEKTTYDGITAIIKVTELFIDSKNIIEINSNSRSFEIKFESVV